MDKFKKLKRFTNAGRLFKTFLFGKSTSITRNNRRRKKYQNDQKQEAVKFY